MPAFFVSKESALSTGVVLYSRSNEYLAVHLFHPGVRKGIDVLYGRAGDASSGEGVSVMRVKVDVDDAVPEGEAKGLDKEEDGPFVYVIVTFRFPILSPIVEAALLHSVIDRCGHCWRSVVTPESLAETQADQRV
jgi:hypothetical protein